MKQYAYYTAPRELGLETKMTSHVYLDQGSDRYVMSFAKAGDAKGYCDFINPPIKDFFVARLVTAEKAAELIEAGAEDNGEWTFDRQTMRFEKLDA